MGERDEIVQGLIGRKLGMSQINDDQGRLIAVTVLRAGPCVVIQKKDRKRDGYEAVQLGLLESRKAKTGKAIKADKTGDADSAETGPEKKTSKGGTRRQNRPLRGHLKKAGDPDVRLLREFSAADLGQVPDVGKTIDVSLFSVEDRVDVTGRSRGMGFTGVMKRYGFGGGKATHGSMFHRAPGSIGASAYPSRVFKGTKMPGRMGNHRVTVRNLPILRVDTERNLLLVGGAVPGPPKGVVLIRKSRTQVRSGAGK